MTEKYTIRLSYTRHLEFEVNADGARQAYAEAKDGFATDDLKPDDDWSDEVSLEGVQHGDREIDFDYRFAWDAPKDERGLTRMLAIAREATNLREIDKDLDLGALLDRVFASEQATDTTTSQGEKQ